MSCLLTQIISSCAASVLSSSTVKKHDNLQQLNRKFEKKKQLELKDLEKKQRLERRAHRGSVIKLLIESQKLQCVFRLQTHIWISGLSFLTSTWCSMVLGKNSLFSLLVLHCKSFSRELL